MEVVILADRGFGVETEVRPDTPEARGCTLSLQSRTCAGG